MIVLDPNHWFKCMLFLMFQFYPKNPSKNEILSADPDSAHCRILSKIRLYFLMSQKSKLMLEFQAHICWVITVDYKVRLGQVKSEFDWKRPKLTRSIRAPKSSIFSVKSNSVKHL